MFLLLVWNEASQFNLLFGFIDFFFKGGIDCMHLTSLSLIQKWKMLGKGEYNDCEGRAVLC